MSLKIPKKLRKSIAKKTKFINKFDENFIFQDYQKLNSFLTKTQHSIEDQDIKKIIMVDVYWVDGFFCACHSSMIPIMPSQWKEFIIGDHVFEGQEEIQDIITSILNVSMNIAKKLQKYSYKPLYLRKQFQNDSYYNFKQWCNGYIKGMNVVQTLNYWDQDIMQLITRYLEPIIVFSTYFNSINLKDLEEQDMEKIKLIMEQQVPLSALRIFDIFHL